MRCCISILRPFYSRWCFCHALYMNLILMTFAWSWYLIANKIWLGLAWLYFWSFDLVEFFPSLFKQPICMIQQCFNQFVVMKTIYYKKFPSFVFDMPHFSNRHLYFLLLVVLRSNLSLYCLYFLPFSQANKTKVFLPIFDLSMTITNLSFFLTSQTYLNKSPLSVKT